MVVVFLTRVLPVILIEERRLSCHTSTQDGHQFLEVDEVVTPWIASYECPQSSVKLIEHVFDENLMLGLLFFVFVEKES